MRIGIDATCWSNKRGFGRFVRELVGAMARLEGGDDYVLFTDRQTAADAVFPANCPVHIGQTSVAATMAATANGRRSIRDMLVMRRIVQREKLDLMFFPAVYSYFPIGKRVPTVVTFHDVIAETLSELVFATRRSKLFWHLKSRAAIRAASRIVTISEASKRGLAHHFGIAERNIRIVSEAPADVFLAAHRRQVDAAQALARHGLVPKGRYLLYVGGISPHKNLDTLIRAFGRVVSNGPLGDVCLVLVGDYQNDSFHTCHQELCELVRRLKLDRSVHFLGFVPDADLAHLYAGAQAFVLASYLEGFGLPVVEAMACGAAVVASKAGSLPEVLKGAAHLVDPHDDRSIADGLHRVLTDNMYRAELQRRSLVRAADFSWDQSARQAHDIFHEMTH